MQKQSFSWFFIRVILFALLMGGFLQDALLAQDTAITRTPEEQKELFGYCEKPALINQLKLSPELADKIGEIDYWALKQQLSVAANTNDAYATENEVKEEVIKKYKALRLPGEQLKALLDFKRGRLNSPEPCSVITLTWHHQFDTLSTQRALQLYKTQYRKTLISTLDINGRQADMLFETEIWKQKESLNIATLSVADFNRIRKTVAMYKEREKKYRAIGLTGQQIEAAIEFFTQHQL